MTADAAGFGMGLAIMILIALVATRKVRPEDVWDE